MTFRNPLMFVAGSTSSEVTVPASSAFGTLASETRLIWCRMDTAPSGSVSLLSQGGGGPSNVAASATAISIQRDYTTTDARADATFANVNIAVGRTFCVASVLTNGVPALYGGGLGLPLTVASAYSSGPTTGVGTLVDKSANSVRIGGFSGVAQGWPGPIWFAAWFPFAMTVAELREAQFYPDKWKALAVAWWAVGAHGTSVVLDQSGNGHHGTMTGAVTSGAYPLTISQDIPLATSAALMVGVG